MEDHRGEGCNLSDCKYEWIPTSVLVPKTFEETCIAVANKSVLKASTQR